MAEPAPAQTPEVPKRITRACERCRARKVKCSGLQPCNHCERKREECRFLDETPRISVSEKYLRDLERRCAIAEFSSHSASRSRSRSPQVNRRDGQMRVRETMLRREPVETPIIAQSVAITPQASPDRPSDLRRRQSPDNATLQPRFGTHQAVNPPVQPALQQSETDFPRNPLLARHSFFRDAGGRYRFLGPSSTWSFSRRVIALMEQHVHLADTPSDPLNLDGAAYKLTWTRVPPGDTPDISGLPSLDYVLYLFNTVKFHLGQLFPLIDEETFVHNLNAFYENPAEKVRSARLWFVQYLLILAFGKAFLVQSHSPSSPAGMEYASRAISLLPDFVDLHGDALLEIEVLCLSALYLQSIDMRIAAFQFIGQALRQCYVEGIHRECPEELHGNKLSKRCSNIWWSVFILDQEFSALMGAPSSIRAEDITTPLPSERDPSIRAAALTLQIHLSRLTAKILSTVYGVDAKYTGSFLSNTQDVLHSLADVSQELAMVVTSRFDSAVGGLSRMSTHITLSYHHCIVLTTRPLVMSILERSLATTAGANRHEKVFLPAPIAALLHTCVESATAIVMTLRSLGDHDLLETFLPFHLEDAFSSAFILSIIQATLPEHILDRSWHTTAWSVLDKMIAMGNAAARLRKAELEHLGLLLAPFARSTSEARAGFRGSVSQGTPQRSAEGNGVSAGGNPNGDWNWDSFFSEGGIGLSCDEMLDLADQLNMDNILTPLVFD